LMTPGCQILQRRARELQTENDRHWKYPQATAQSLRTSCPSGEGDLSRWRGNWPLALFPKRYLLSSGIGRPPSVTID
jgi:hypothetical protein